ncbi:MAG: hypothetical protein COB38_12820 [Gammaproteobacteria bacterium]|nr:MAG: hypothetical protein COB38_12820 [Gammaproteobacteria bacterium]
MNIKILPIANDDLLNGYYFYEKQKKGIGSYFLDSLFSDIDSLMLYQSIHPIIFNQYHRLLSKRFPFAIYYKIEYEYIVVYAVLDCRKEPAWIEGRLE